MSSSAIELAANSPRSAPAVEHTSTNEANDFGNEESQDLPSLPPVDGGKAAAQFLFGAFLIEALLWGYPLAFGVFQNYYTEHLDDKGNIAVIGTSGTALFYLGAPVIIPLSKRYPHWQRPMVFVGWFICIISLLAASFPQSVPGLIATQGVLYGLGFLILYYPVLSMLNEWFIQRKGLAFGILYSATGLPFILSTLLSHYGHRTTLRASAVALAILTAPALPLLKGRLPIPSGTSRTTHSPNTNPSFLTNPLFYIFALSNLFQGLGFFIPAIYLPSFASALGFPPSTSALVLSATNLAQVFGQLSFGHASDRTSNVLILIFASSFIPSMAAFTLWGLAKSLTPLIFFAIVYGWFAGGFVVLWSRFATELTEDPLTAQDIFGVLAFEKGIGNILTGPVSAALTRGGVRGGYGLGKYAGLIVFLGAAMFASSLGIVGWPLRRVRASG